MTDNEVNIPLLRKAVEWAEVEAAKPVIDRRWLQAGWVNSPESVAEEALDDSPFGGLGWAARRVVVERVAQHCGTAYCIAGYVGQSLDERYAARDEVDGVHVADFAREALGLDQGQASPDRGSLFYGGNTIEDVRRIAEDIAGERL